MRKNLRLRKVPIKTAGKNDDYYFISGKKCQKRRFITFTFLNKFINAFLIILLYQQKTSQENRN